MEMVFASDVTPYRDGLYQLCLCSDKDFVPPLSQRGSTTQSSLSGGESSGIDAYFQKMLSQPILLCIENGEPQGFVSFRENYVPEHYPQARTPNIYISTLILSPKCRGKGLTKALYDHLFFHRFEKRSIYTRTWSTNTAHIKILEYFGFSQILCLPDHRGPGIHTVYFALER